MRWSTLMPIAAFALAATSCVTRGVSVTERAAVAPGGVAPTASAPLLGDWTGSILVGGRTIGIAVHFSEGSSGLAGTIDIPSQLAAGLPLQEVRQEGQELWFVLQASSDVARFHGRVSGNEIAGDFRQGPAAGTFSLTRGAERMGGAGGAQGGAGSAPPSFAPGESGITLATPTGTLYGTLDLPAGSGPFPVALIIAGSGPTDRNGNSPLLPGANDSLTMVAHLLRGIGIASVRYDKRGVGESATAMGAESELRFSTYIEDAARWIERLKQDPRFTRIAVIGHSEGSLIGMVAARIAGADAFVSLDGAGRPAYELLKSQLAGQPEALRSRADAIIDSLEKAREVPTVPSDLMALFRPSVQPYLISWFRYNPQKEIARLDIPILIVQGTTDLQVPVADAELLHAAQPRSTLRIIKGMNHVLKFAPADPQANIAAYSNPKLPLAPALASALTDFLEAVLKAPN